MNHEWKCPRCQWWSPDMASVTRCHSCGGPRPDVAEYRKVRGPSWRERLADLARRRLEAARRPAPADLLWVCPRCSAAHPTTMTTCPDCFESRPIHPVLRLGRSRPPRRVPGAALAFGGVLIMGASLAWGSPWAAVSGLLVWSFGDNLMRGR